MKVIMPLLLIAISFAIYMLPAVVAMKRAHNNRLAIIVGTVVTGWTGLGWLFMLVWACTANVERPHR